ncbi:MAG TPA: HAD-IIA family hydrolase [Mycobacteriales bacterium]|nr:HAD-IIA family hydrolase [Mycobacteriales bacterium]
MGPASPAGLGTSERPLHEVYDAALLDLDGVLYVGPDPVPHAAASIAAARDAGMRAAFVTNNASRRPAAVAEHLTALGIPADPDDVVTSAQAAVRYLVARLPAGSRILVVGTDGLAEEVEAAGLRPVRDAAGALAVVQGLSTATTWEDLAEAAVAIRAGALWVAGNRDATYPSARGPVPGNGAFVAALETATGATPVVVGKPQPELHMASVERVGARRPLVVGDRLDTDVLGARATGTDCLLVLTGVTELDELLAAPPESRPTFVGWDLRALLVPHPPVSLAGDGAACGEGRAVRAGAHLDLQGPQDLALRAACGLAWSG